MITASNPTSQASPHLQIERIPRLIRFASVGGACALLQLAALHLLVELNVDKSVANLFALVCFAQFNFALSSIITWTDRREPDRNSPVVQRMARYNGMILVSALANQLTFMVAITHVEYLIAGVLSLLVGAIINYLASDRLVFTA